MKLCFRIVLLLFLVAGTLTEDGFDLGDALFDDPDPTPSKPTKQPEKPKSGGELDLFDAFGPENPQPEIPNKPDKPSSGDADGFGFDLSDALKPDPKTDKPDVKPPSSGGGGGGGGKLDDSDLFDLTNGDYKPDGGHGGHRPLNPNYDNQGGGGADQPQAEAGSGQIAGIASAIGVALLGAASSYFAYQKKKLCFKLQGGADPERGKGHHGTQSDGTQIFSNLLRTT